MKREREERHRTGETHAIQAIPQPIWQTMLPNPGPTHLRAVCLQQHCTQSLWEGKNGKETSCNLQSRQSMHAHNADTHTASAPYICYLWTYSDLRADLGRVSHSDGFAGQERCRTHLPLRMRKRQGRGAGLAPHAAHPAYAIAPFPAHIHLHRCQTRQTGMTCFNHAGVSSMDPPCGTACTCAIMLLR